MTIEQHRTPSWQPGDGSFRRMSLDLWLEERVFPVWEVVQILKQAAEALQPLHDKGVVHQHIAPWTLFWSDETQTLTLLQPDSDKKTESGSGFLFRSSSTENSLLYVSPEQTGRVGQRVDHRSDLYSLGVVAWHLLVGRPPFQAAEPRALIHAHLASRPVPPHLHRDDIPLVLSEMILKLLAKHADERYQTARGLKLDLQRCIESLERGETTNFALGQYDQFLQLLYACPLYGREREKESLYHALDAAQEGAREFVLVRGAPGIGKTALVQSLSEPTYQCRGHFARGRFELLQGDIPYHAFQTALCELMQEILAEDGPRLLYWGARIKQSLGKNGGVLVPLVPELGYLLGEVPTVEQLPPQENRIRIQNAFADLFRALTSPQHPLILSLDDLQWADNASLELVEFLVTDQKLKGFVLVGGYRDTDEDVSIQLGHFLQAIEQRCIPVTSISLPPLTFLHLRQMLCELCNCPPQRVEPLAALLLEKTAGNPFFVRTLLQQIYQERLLWLDRSGWCWDEESIHNLKCTDNVVSLLVASLKQQPEETQRMLQFAACLGHQFKASELTAFLDTTDDVVELLLQPCVHQHLLSMSDSSMYRFVHDRVQEAAYELMSEDDKTATHLQVGKFLLSQSQQHEESDRLYDVIRHLQHGLSQSIDGEERVEFAHVALKAAQRARRDGAFESAFGSLDWGLRLLGPSRWLEHYELTLSLTGLVAEMGLACRQRERVEQYIDELLAQGRTLEDQLPGWKSRVQLLNSEHKMAESLDVINRFFALTGTPLIRPQSRIRFVWELAKTLWLIGRRKPEELETLPKVTDPLMQGILDLQVQSSVAYSVHNPDLAPIMILRDVQGALRHGMTGPNIQCWTGIGGIMSSIFGRVEIGNRYGKLARKQLEQFHRPELNPRIEIYILSVLNAWSSSFAELGDSSQAIAKQALDVGDLLSTFLLRSLRLISIFYAGRPIAAIEAELLAYKQDLQHYQYDLNRDFSHTLKYYFTLLQGSHPPPATDLELPEASGIASMLTQWVRPSLEIQIYLLFGQEYRAFQFAQLPRKSLQHPASVMFLGAYWTYALVALYHGLEQGWGTRWRCRKMIRLGTRELHRWAKHRPDTRQYRLTWVQAAKLRSRDRGFLALEQYDSALKQATDAGFLQDAALIAEQAASLCESLGHRDMAVYFRSKAIAHYQTWGATSKVNQLQQYDTVWLQEVSVKRLSQPGDANEHLLSTVEQLKLFDLEAVLRASKALSQESERQALLSRLMHLVMENAGAERGLLLLHHQDSWNLVAQVEDMEPDVQLPDSIVDLDDGSAIMSTAMLRYTILSHDSVVLEDASLKGPFVRDPYVIAARPRSVLCLPILLQGRLIGLMYLENRLAAGVFNQQRQDILSVIATQAAVSLEVLQSLSSGEIAPPRFAPGAPVENTSSTAPRRTLDEPLLQMSSVPSRDSQQRNVPAGHTIGDWQVLQEIAKGGMSTIFKVRNRMTNQLAALKLMQPMAHEQASRSRRFEREAQLLESFHHPNIISLLDFDIDPMYGAFMVLELLEGENLQSILERHAPVPLGWWLPISEQLCDALATVHNEGVLHRDLKPSNIFISPGEPFPHLTLLDFGIANKTDISKEIKLTSTGVIVGTPAYLAPEQLKDKEDITTATDLYALGVIWFEALTGKHPMGGGSSVELFVKILQEKPTALGKLRPEFQDTELEALISQLLHKNPKHRPDHVQFVWDELSMSCQFIEDPNDIYERYPKILP